MFDEFIFDLKAARKMSGLTQKDCGHLIGGSEYRISQLERGQRLPTIREICTLSLVFGKNFESLYGAIFDEVRNDLEVRLGHLSEPEKTIPGHHNRTRTLERLHQRLLDESGTHHDS
ncbi:helix-turn-helix transcriptional regulator [Aliiroseovarius sp. F47248L]|uniref:helix-turn-helix domain-containing protein n=1 Tax=Aliiroseovarius sp. F47248L TaxID=2926420 RepID=UPI001FF16D94|nr:helix-turn-helix transcriptional regulator [Aliiroseovarius sp. F47248L]MCK0138923.1 helix-turn-helix transcriptional regulator [Aliiroseovarius sp. F47248L]